MEQRREKFFNEMTGAPTNSVGLSSVVHGTGAIDQTDTLLKSLKRKRELKTFQELTGSTMTRLQNTDTPITTKPKRKRTKIIINLPLDLSSKD